MPIPSLLSLGRFAEARDWARRYEQSAAAETRADEALAAAWRVEIEALAGEWPRVREHAERVRTLVGTGDLVRRVSAARASLLAAVAHTHLGDSSWAAWLERSVDDLQPGDDIRIAAPRIRLAIARRDRDRLATL